MAQKLTARQRVAVQQRKEREANNCLTDPEFHPDPRVAARHLDSALMKKRGETPPWEEATDGE
jgi:hypothetical protein